MHKVSPWVWAILGFILLMAFFWFFPMSEESQEELHQYQDSTYRW